MNNHFIAIILAVITAIAASVTSTAQASIDRLVNEFEKDKSVEVTYSEHRNPKTKKIAKQNIVLVGHSNSQAAKLWKAFESERKNSIRVTKNRDQSFIIKFQDSKYSLSYVLNVSESYWQLVVTKRELSENGDDVSFIGDIDLSGLDGLCLNLDALKALDGLDNLNSLESLGELNNLNIKNINGNVTVYDGDGNVIYQSTKNKAKSSSKAKSRTQSGSKSKSKSSSNSLSRSGNTIVKTVTTTSTDYEPETVVTCNI